MNSIDPKNDDDIPPQHENYFKWLLSKKRLSARNKAAITSRLALNFCKSSWWRNFLYSSAKVEVKCIIKNIPTDFYLKTRIRPKQLYRYRPLQTPGYEESQLDRIREIICDNKLWFSSVDSLNDPNEFQASRGWQINWHSPSYRDTLAIWSDYNINDYLSKTGVCCFSESPKNMALWSYYANSHYGVCLGFATNSELLEKVFPVRYVNLDPQLRPQHYLSPDDLMRRALIHKHVDWRNENEWRIVQSGQAGLISFPSAILNSIIFGIRVIPTDFLAIQKMVQTLSPGLIQYAAVPSPKGITLEPLIDGPFTYASQFAMWVVSAQPRLVGPWKSFLGQRQ